MNAIIKKFIESGNNGLVKKGLQLLDEKQLEYNFHQFLSIYDWLQSNLTLDKGHTTIEQKIRFLNSLKSLNLSDLKLKVLPRGFSLLKNLTFLDLSNNLFEKFPDRLLAFHNLKSINLSNNRIRKQEILPIYSRSVDTLDFSGNDITQVDFLISFPNIKVLFLDENKELKFSKDILLLNKLSKLKIRACNLETLPMYIVDLKSLTYLDLSENFLTDLPEKILLKKGLRTLSLNYNKFTKETLRSYSKIVDGSFELSYSY